MSTKQQFDRPRKLEPVDECGSFDCGQSDLNEWFERYALVSQKSGMATVFVSTAGDSIAGYYALATGGVEPALAPDRVLRGTGGNPVPVVLLARLAVDVRFQGVGVGKGLVADCLRRVLAASEEVGVRALLVHAKDESARRFYFSVAEFEPSPTDPLHLFLLMKDLRKALED